MAAPWKRTSTLLHDCSGWSPWQPCLEEPTSQRTHPCREGRGGGVDNRKCTHRLNEPTAYCPYRDRDEGEKYEKNIAPVVTNRK